MDKMFLVKTVDYFDGKLDRFVISYGIFTGITKEGVANKVKNLPTKYDKDIQPTHTDIIVLGVDEGLI